ncbi:shikimate dehydrogenase [Sphingomonas bisphenolicum]|uniref:Shikimate dehydrogenase (NADP(+)) n=1 Tax=Sphingomonas bisphenolicum TaxID=296544 RepID=A0ABN5WQH0_9SPHN|nr:shikimate dehydrogenase [Sphingomonas bisphenolicum]BBF71807.1 shikimate dehydrogenase (NADP(+)) [Sphingomonas bisphenolicum]
MTQSRSVPRYLTGLIGRDIQASLTPRLHESEADAQGIRLIYRLFDFAADGMTGSDLPRLLDALHLAGFAGVNVTHPYKQAVIAHLDELSPQAAQIGSVNTVVFRDGRRIGYNTDVSGFAENLRSGLPQGAAMTRVVQMGAGGAGAATAHALMDLGVTQLTLFDSDTGRATALCDALCGVHGIGRAVVGHDLSAAIALADGIVNATPMGMAVHPGSAIPRDLLDARLWVTDIVYFPLETQLLREARAAGCTTLDGSGMTIFQAVGAFRHFTGRSADPVRMGGSFRAALQS